MYLFLLRMYLGFQHSFWDKEGPPITYRRFPKEYIDRDKGDRDPCSLSNGCTYFSYGCIYFFMKLI